MALQAVRFRKLGRPVGIESDVHRAYPRRVRVAVPRLCVGVFASVVQRGAAQQVGHALPPRRHVFWKDFSHDRLGALDVVELPCLNVDDEPLGGGGVEIAYIVGGEEVERLHAVQFPFEMGAVTDGYKAALITVDGEHGRGISLSERREHIYLFGDVRRDVALDQSVDVVADGERLFAVL